MTHAAPNDLLIHVNGRPRTVDKTNPHASAAAIFDEEFLAASGLTPMDSLWRSFLVATIKHP